MIKAITFDLDNTLVDFMKMKRASSNAAAKAMVKAGLDMPVKQAETELFNDYIKDIEGEHVFQDFLKKHNKFKYKVLAAALNAYLETKYTYLKPYPKVKNTLRRLKKKGLKLAIVTDAPKLKAYQRLHAMGITDFFDVVVGFEDTKTRKPSSLPFKQALKELKVKPEETLHIGDYMERDVLGAKKLGMKTAWAKYGRNKLGKKVDADYILNNIEELERVVKNDIII